MPTGGINLDNIGSFQKAGAVAFGIGSALVNTKQEITDEYLLALTGLAEKFVSAITSSILNNYFNPTTLKKTTANLPGSAFACWRLYS
jgi:hypothetical protein